MRRWIGIGVFLLLGGAALVSAGAEATVGAAGAMGPQAMVQQTGERLVTKLRKDHDELKAHPGRLYGLVSELLVPHFDFETMSRYVLGRYWRTASPAQRDQFVGEFRTLLVRTYATALLEYRDQTIRYLPFHGDLSSGDVTVRSEVVQPGGRSIPIDYSVDLRNGEWRVYDVTVDGVSLVTNYRGSFASEIQTGGLDKLLDKLKQRNQQLSQAK
ncbi:MAG: hypothetical protein B7Z66_01735 [Chromatiales bacterium 21-64-14]|nr:MAG: hypothetical protein B7Z66_01735 [Chromatiales bacterium 21-64-14]HQU14935.1 ABC transporter substrate-binding protein [Gammaproteobacteria bacterium]